MSTGTYLLVDADGVIINAVMWDGDVTNWQPPPGLTAHKCDDPVYQLGWKWDGGKAVDPNPPPSEPETPPPIPAKDGGPDVIS